MLPVAVEERRVQPRRRTTGSRETGREAARRPTPKATGPCAHPRPRGSPAARLRRRTAGPANPDNTTPFRAASDCPAAAPARAAAEIAGMIERQHGRFLERRSEKRRRGVGLVMLHHGDLRLGETVRAATRGNATPGRARTAAPPPRIPPRPAWLRARRRHSVDRRLRQSAGPPGPRASLASSIAAFSSPSFRTAQAASPSKPPSPRITMLFVDFSSRSWPTCRVSATVRLNTRLARRRIGVHAKIAQPLELIATARRWPRARLGSSLQPGNDFERIRIQIVR